MLRDERTIEYIYITKRTAAIFWDLHRPPCFKEASQFVLCVHRARCQIPASAIERWEEDNKVDADQLLPCDNLQSDLTLISERENWEEGTVPAQWIQESWQYCRRRLSVWKCKFTWKPFKQSWSLYQRKADKDSSMKLFWPSSLSKYDPNHCRLYRLLSHRNRYIFQTKYLKELSWVIEMLAAAKWFTSEGHQICSPKTKGTHHACTHDASFRFMLEQGVQKQKVYKYYGYLCTLYNWNI